MKTTLPNPFRLKIRPLLYGFVVVVLAALPTLAETNAFMERGKVMFGDCANGYGKVVWPEGKPKGTCPGMTYEGYFVNGIPNGYGKLFYPATGCIYFGEFKDGKENGIGTLRWPDGQGYTGEYKDGEPHGTGFSFGVKGEVRINKIGEKSGLTLLVNGNLEREDIYRVKPTKDSKTPTGVFVPENLDGCLNELEVMLTPEFVQKIRDGSEDEMSQYHFGLGMWMRNNWGLWGGSRLAKWFNAQGIKDPDDMSGIILVSFWRHLHKKPIRMDEQIKFYQDYWKKQITTQH
jgi:hypothetical protein